MRRTKKLIATAVASTSLLGAGVAFGEHADGERRRGSGAGLARLFGHRSRGGKFGRPGRPARGPPGALTRPLPYASSWLLRTKSMRASSIRSSVSSVPVKRRAKPISSMR